MTDTGTTPAATTTPEPKRAPRWRRWTAGALIVLSCVLAPLSVVAVWVRNQLLNTDRYVENVTPLASNPAVISTVATNVTDTLFERVDVETEAKQVLPPRAAFLATPLAAALHDVVLRAVTTIMESDQFKTVWAEANRVAHKQLQKALTNQGKVVNVQNGKVVLDLSALVENARTALDQRGIGIFDHIPAAKLSMKVELLDAKQLSKAQRATNLLNKLSLLLPVLAVVFLGIGLALSPNRRRSLIRWGIGTAGAVALVGAGVAIGRYLYLDAVTSPQLPRDTAAVVFDTLVRFLREGIRVIIALALVIAIGAWLTGSTPVASRLRATARSTMGSAGGAAEAHGLSFGGFGVWVAAHRGQARIGALLLALVALLLWNHPTGVTVLLLAVLLLVVVGLIEFVARASLAHGAAPPAASSPVPHPSG